MADRIFQKTDGSGKVTMTVFRQQAPAPAASFIDFQVDVDDDMVVIGGGATGAEVPAGALLTASYPNNGKSAWLVSSKDHRVSNPHRVTGFAIGLKVAGMSREQLAGAVRVARQTSSRAAHPSASASLPAGFILVGGGFRVNWQPGQGNLATASFPEFGNVWTARSKDHFVSSPCTIDSFAIGLPARLAVAGAATVERSVASDESGVAAHPSITEPMNGPFVLTGIGAEARFNEPGSLLWRLEPTVGGKEPGVTAASKDHEVSSPASVKAWAIGIRLV